MFLTFLSTQFALTIVGIIIGGILMVATVILGIIALAGGRMQQAGIWLIGFIVSVSIVAFSIVQLVDRVREKVATGVDWVSHHQTYNGDRRPFDYSKQHRQDLINALKPMVDIKHINNIPESFYTNPDNKFEVGSENTDTLPFVYPLAFAYNNYNYNLINILNKNQNVFLVENISRIKYDNHFLLIKVDKTPESKFKDNEPEISYILFDLKTGQQKQFLNSRKLFDEATAMGYTGSNELENISDVYKDWFEYKSGDED